MVDYTFTFFTLTDTVVEDFTGPVANKDNVNTYGSNTRFLTFTNPQTVTVQDDDPDFDDDDGNSWGPINDAASAQAVVSGGALPVGMVVDNESSLIWFDENTGSQYTMLIVSQVDQFGTSLGVKGFAFVGVVPPVDVRITLDNNFPNGPQLNTAPNNPYSSLAVCFAAGTLIQTDRGPVAVEALVQGDLVVTRDNGLQPIRWIGSQKITSVVLAHMPNLRPIRIRRHALGANIPSADLMVSPQHRVLVRSRIAQKMFGTDEILVGAKQLCQVEGIDIAEDVPHVAYFHMLFERHEIVLSNGAETESLFTGTEALKSVGRAARAEIFAIFPQLQGRDYQPVAARVMATGRMGRKLAVRHARNSKAFVS
ncbi:MAG: Hint domain-containing protein [Paracoccus sp. (in: a-proteobacteria)]|nr:Hint domain-containing protein [Paracoccus sp. (in: a-proteobacteria)]